MLIPGLLELATGVEDAVLASFGIHHAQGKTETTATLLSLEQLFELILCV